MIRWILLACAAALAVILVLAAAAVRASRSKPAATPTQQTQNPYRRFYSDPPGPLQK